MGDALMVGAAVALAGAVLALTLMPGRSRQSRVSPVAEPVPA